MLGLAKLLARQAARAWLDQERNPKVPGCAAPIPVRKVDDE